MQRFRTFSIGQRRLYSNLNDRDVVVCGFARTPIGKFNGGLASKTAPQLGAIAVSEAINRAGINKDFVEEAFLGNVVSAGIGQAPTRQAILYAGLKNDTPCTTINKVCASGMKAAMFASLSVTSGYRNVVIAGGMESMSNIPYYLPQARNGYRMGNGSIIDGLIHDGLWDVYGNQHMGMCGEDCATKYGITRDDQDQFAIRSYARAQEAWSAGKFTDEVVPVKIEGKRGEKPIIIEKDEEFSSVKLDKVPTLKAAFKKDGTITAANASKINDGASAMVVVSGKVTKDLKLKPLFKIRGFGDAARAPIEFTTAPSDAIPRALAHAGLKLSDVDYHEINEAFSVVVLANAKILNLDLDKVNVHGGAVALGHPIGSSGARIIGTLYNVLKAKDATIGCASICNGGGGASAIVIERLN
eukprot:CAMPEP_0173152592 /NCGR_PEP_ID=MMETSP1105-20130129/12335_1 /TAXON_ID=2985 /ORGANISM="Ochromonas sp., Strain BG-1" /LENGTH=413 /DNA_ID=CAMNT_0014068323 /DNA_START=36 /DNA_END=1277 /DNA_ORIENTATION=-